MIKINLLPVRAAKKKETMRQAISVAVLSLVFVLIIIGYFHVSIGKQIADVNSRTASAQDELTKTKAQIGEVAKFKEAKKAVEDKLGVIVTLKKAKAGPVKMLDELSKITPEKLWINSFKEKGGSIEMDGVAISNEVVAQFMTELEQSQYFKDVELIQTEQVDQGALKLKKFNLTCKLKVPEAAKEADTKGKPKT